MQMESPNIDAAGRPGHLGPGASGCSNYADSQYDRLELIDDPAQSLRLVCLHRTRSTRIPALAHAHPPRRFRSGRSESSSSAWSAVLLNDLFGVLFAY